MLFTDEVHPEHLTDIKGSGLGFIIVENVMLPLILFGMTGLVVGQ